MNATLFLSMKYHNVCGETWGQGKSKRKNVFQAEGTANAKEKKTKEDTWRPDNKESNHCAFLLGWLTSSPFHKSILLRSKHFLSCAMDRIMPSVIAAHFAFIPESRSCKYWSLRALELVLRHKLSHHNEKPVQSN